MSINSAQIYLQGLVDGIAVPNSLTIEAHITPPDPEVDYTNPHAYIWPSDGEEHRLTIPRNSSQNAPTGTKETQHVMDIFIVWFASDEDPDADTWFPGMVDAVMAVLRTTPTPAVVQDPYTGDNSEIEGTGERMNYKLAVSAVEDERFNRYDALITVFLTELFTS